MAAEARDAPPNIPFSHMVAVDRGDVGLRSRYVGIRRRGRCPGLSRDSRHGGVSAIQIDAALPMVCTTSKACDKGVVRSSATSLSIDGSQEADTRLRVNGLRGAIWVTDGGDLEVGRYLLCLRPQVMP
jgi:hypothetical protein